MVPVLDPQIGDRSVATGGRGTLVRIGLMSGGVAIAVAGAATRKRRLAAIRLVGATRGQTRWLAAAETGAVGGLMLFLVARWPVAGLMPVPSGVFAADVVPPVSLILLVACGVPVLAGGPGDWCCW